jgi:hypothetical protein
MQRKTNEDDMAIKHIKRQACHEQQYMVIAYPIGRGIINEQ